MKKLLTILLLVSIFLQSIGYFAVWGTFKLNQQFIADNLCINRFDAIPICYGSCFLEDQFKASKQQLDDSPDFSAVSTAVFIESTPTLQTQTFTELETQTFTGYKQAPIPKGYYSLVFQPPIV